MAPVDGPSSTGGAASCCGRGRTGAAPVAAGSSGATAAGAAGAPPSGASGAATPRGASSVTASGCGVDVGGAVLVAAGAATSSGLFPAVLRPRFTSRPRTRSASAPEPPGSCLLHSFHAMARASRPRSPHPTTGRYDASVLVSSTGVMSANMGLPFQGCVVRLGLPGREGRATLLFLGVVLFCLFGDAQGDDSGYSASSIRDVRGLSSCGCVVEDVRELATRLRDSHLYGLLFHVHQCTAQHTIGGALHPCLSPPEHPLPGLQNP